MDGEEVVVVLDSFRVGIDIGIMVGSYNVSLYDHRSSYFNTESDPID
jgi:hypothetical protein